MALAPSEPLFVGGVQVEHRLVDQALLGGVVADELRADLLDDGEDGLLDALALVAVRVAVAELDGLEGAGGGAGRDGSTARAAVVEADLDLDRGVASGVEDFPGYDDVDGRHEHLLLGCDAGVVQGLACRPCDMSLTGSGRSAGRRPPPGTKQVRNRLALPPRHRNRTVARITGRTVTGVPERPHGEPRPGAYGGARRGGAPGRSARGAAGSGSAQVQLLAREDQVGVVDDVLVQLEQLLPAALDVVRLGDRAEGVARDLTLYSPSPFLTFLPVGVVTVFFAAGALVRARGRLLVGWRVRSVALRAAAALARCCGAGRV